MIGRIVLQRAVWTIVAVVALAVALLWLNAAAPHGPGAESSPFFIRYGVLALVFLWLISAVLCGDLNPLALAMGADNRLSTSKLQALLWTACVGFVYAMVDASRVMAAGRVDPITNIPENVLFALGISATSAVAAKAITTSQVATSPNHKDGQPTPSYDPSALVRDDGASTASLTKVQILFWTVVAIVVYINNAYHDLGPLATCTANCSFPDIDTTLMIFMGLGHATYLGGKLVQTSNPALTGVTELHDDQGVTLVIAGSALGPSGTVLFNNVPLDRANVVSWTPTEVRVRPPAQWAAGDAITVAVSTGGGAPSPAISFTYGGASGAKGTTAAPLPAQPPKPPPPKPQPAPAPTPQPGHVPAPKPAPAPQPSPPPAPKPPPPVPPQGRPRGIDVSYAQETIDWDAVKQRGGCDFAYARASYGAQAKFDDDNFARNHDECKRLGIPFGAYHFFRFTESAADQAQHFLSRIDGRSGTLCPMVDVEEGSGALGSAAQMVAALSAFIQAVEKALNSQVIIYTNADTWNSNLGGTDAFAGHKLWVTNFTDNLTGQPAMPSGFKSWAIWQYSDKGSITTTSGATHPLDLDIAAGTIDDLKQQPLQPGGGPANAASAKPAPPSPTSPAPVPPLAAGQLTPHFSLAELTTTSTGLNNTPPPSVIPALQHLAEFLELVRHEVCHDQAITIDSAYRSPAVNAAVGGVPNSAHAQGHAADTTTTAFGTIIEYAQAIKTWIDHANIAFDQIIFERNVWVHISPQHDDFGQRRQFLTFDGSSYTDGIHPL
ncbi:MAG TPA: GH25 family lysozyme [Candidatus Elarobacter sp.]|nr:GH25 family lysozyme [Candidatus Elarobacter sp.]